MKYLVLKRATLLGVVCVFLLCAILSLPLGENSISAVFFGDNLRKVPIYSVDTTEKKVAISFDAAWGADKTEKIMDILEEYQVNATFFLVGFWADKYADIVREIDKRGFEIGTHSNTHPDLSKLSSEQVKLELTQSIEKINSACSGVSVKLFRPPFGAYNNTVIDVADSIGLKTIQWNVDSLDWKGGSGAEICERIMGKVKNGSIILCHNNADHILEALPLVLDRLKMQNYSVVSVGELIYLDNYTIDRAGVQHKVEGTGEKDEF
ncbi:MAG: polysaccharide deacetylase family protein [Clostridia bacterium]|nr:polysaccharide deacetylase family protein [Clostridia bacterium]